MHRKEGEHPFGDMGQLILLGLFLIAWVVDSFHFHVSTFLSASLTLPLRLVLLFPVLVTALYLVRSGHGVVSREGRGSGVVSTGAFRYVRHPLYLGSILIYFCLAVATASLLSLALSALIAVFYNHIASYEEEFLRANHGEAYSGYAAKTGKWLPAIWNEPGNAGLGR